MSMTDAVINFPVSPHCRAEVVMHGEVDGAAVDKLIAALRLFREQFDEEPAPRKPAVEKPRAAPAKSEPLPADKQEMLDTILGHLREQGPRSLANLAELVGAHHLTVLAVLRRSPLVENEGDFWGLALAPQEAGST